MGFGTYRILTVFKPTTNFLLLSPVYQEISENELTVIHN